VSSKNLLQIKMTPFRFSFREKPLRVGQAKRCHLNFLRNPG
jgi:hypothetical protein